MDVSVFELDGKRITVFPGVSGSPVVYLNCFENPPEDIDRQIALPHSLVCISRMNWNDDLSPWRADGLSRRDPPFAGGADTYLAWLGSAVIPTVEKGLQKPGNRIIAGYSLAGLFALYAVYQCDLFTRCVSASGSLWYPGFVDFCRTHPCSTSVTDVYLSLGDREHLTRQPVLASVRSCTEEIYQLLDARGIRCMLGGTPAITLSMKKGAFARASAGALRKEATRCYCALGKRTGSQTGIISDVRKEQNERYGTDLHYRAPASGHGFGSLGYCLCVL